MSIASVAHKYAFGLKSDVRGNLHWLDDTTVVYPCGANTILYQLETRTQRFLPMQEGFEAITSMALAPNKRYLAISETGMVNSTMVIYDMQTLRKRKTLSGNEAEIKGYLNMMFSGDSKYLVSIVQTKANESLVQLWSWEKAKVMASIKCSVTLCHQVLFNPWDSTQVSVVGPTVFKCYRFVEGTMKQFGNQKLELKSNFCHLWISDVRTLVACGEGRLMIFENGEYKTEMVNTYGPTNTPKEVYAMTLHSRGFICGCQGGGVTIYERYDEFTFKKVKEFSVPDDCLSDITHLALSINEEVLLVTMKNSQIYSLQLISSELKAEGSKFEQFAQPFHSGPVTGLDTCIRKPLLVTCSTDRSVHCWNYLDFTCELVKYFAEEAHSIALHPSGLYILVGFSDKLRLMNLLIDDIRSFREFPIRRCRECCFSHGGQYFAAVHGNVIQLYNTWTFELMGTFKGHNGKVRSLAWSPDDLRLISAGMEGAVYEWNIREMHRNSENVLKSCSYTCAVSAVDGNAIYAVGSDKSIKEIIDSQIVREIPSTAVLSQLVISHSGRMLFTATSQGTVRSIKFPFQLSETGECQEHQGHGGAVTRLRVSMDDQYLFSSSEDGSVMVWKISDRGAFTKKEKEIVYADEILVTKGDLEEKKNTMMELRSRVDELKMENEYQLRLKDMQLNERLHETTEKFQDEIEGLKMTSAVLKADKEKEELRHEEEMAEEINKHAKRMEELESSHSVKLMNEYEKYQDLQNKANYMEQQWQLQLDILKTEKQTTLQEFTTQYETTLRERQVEIDRVQEEIRQQKKEFKETTKESEEDGDLEIISLRYKYEKKLSEEREVGLRLKGENGIMKKKFNTLNSEIEAHKGEIQKALMEEKKLHSVIKSLEKDIAGLKKEILERDDTIQDKEKRIYDLKKKNQELEKFKFVLDYKIKELKKQIEPRENDISAMTEQIKKMEAELSAYHTSNQTLTMHVDELKLRLKAAEHQVTQEHRQRDVYQTYVNHFKRDLHTALQWVQDPKRFKPMLKHVYRTYGHPNEALFPTTTITPTPTTTTSLSTERVFVPLSLGASTNSSSSTTSTTTTMLHKEERGGVGSGRVSSSMEKKVEATDLDPTSSHSELVRQRAYLERTLIGLRRMVVQDLGVHRSDQLKRMQENATLMQDINGLRKEIQVRGGGRIPRSIVMPNLSSSN